MLLGGFLAAGGCAPSPESDSDALAANDALSETVSLDQDEVAPPAPEEVAPPDEDDASPAESDVSSAQTHSLTLHGSGIRALAEYMGQASYELIAAVYDDTRGSRVGWKILQTAPGQDTYTFDWPDLLEPHHAYRVALSSMPCVGPVVRRFEDVGASVDIDVSPACGNHIFDESDDAEAEALLNTPIELPAGLYSANSSSSNAALSLIVTADGRLIRSRFKYGCRNAGTGCESYLADTSPICQPFFIRADTGAARIIGGGNNFSLDVSVAPDGDRLHITGSMSKYNCCQEEVDWYAVRTGDASSACDEPL